MSFASALAIYALFWSFCLFLVLPFRLRSGAGDDEVVPGTDRGAPSRFSPGRTALWTTIVSAIAFGCFYLNYVEGWIMPDALDFFSPPDRLR